MEPLPPQRQIVPKRDTPDTSHSVDGQYMGKSATPFLSQKELRSQSYSKTLQRKSLYQRAVKVIKPIIHLIRYHETLSSRVGKIEESRVTPENRLPFLNSNLGKIAQQFNGDDAAKLFDFSDGCCFGLTSNYILFETLGEQERFDKILSTLSQNPQLGWVFWGEYYPNLAEAIEEAQNEVRRNPRTTDPDTLLLIQLRPFCEALLLFQSPETTALASSFSFQDTNAAAQLITPENIDSDDTLQSTPYYSVGLKPEGFERLLSNIGGSVSKGQPDRLFHISSGGHIIVLKVSSQGYEIFDQNIVNYTKKFSIGEEGRLASFLSDRVQKMPFDIGLPFHNNSIFEIGEFFKKSVSSSSQTEKNGLNNLLKEIPEDQQCSVNEQNFNGYSQLHLAAWQNNVEDVNSLLKNRDLKLNSVRYGQSSQSMETALHSACAKGNTEVVKILIKDDRCSSALLSSENKTPLWFASEGGHESIVKALLEVTPESINTSDNNGQSPLFIAAFLNHFDIVQQLTKHPDLEINQKRADGATALHTASYAGNEKILELLLNCPNIQVDSRTNDGETPLKMAIVNGHLNCVTILLDHGALVDEDCIKLAEAAGYYQTALQLTEKLKPSSSSA